MNLIILIFIVIWSIYLHNKLLNCEAQLREIKDYLNINIEEKSYDNNIKINDDITEEEITDQKIIEDKSHKTPNINFENIFLGNIFTIIGAIATIAGFAIFIKLISPYIIFTPLLKTLIGFIFGLTMITGGMCIKKEKMKHFAEIMTGTGFAILFTTVYISTVLFKTFSSVVCLFIASLILITAYYIAHKQKTVSMIVISLIGGYLNIFFTGINSDVKFMFSYLIFLNLMSVIYVYKNPNKAIINIINLTAAFICISVYYLLSKLSFYDFTINVAYPLVLWSIYLIYDIIRKNKNSDAADTINLLNWFNFAILTIFSILIFQKERVYIGWLLLVVGIIYGIIVLSFVKNKLQNYKPYLYSMFITAFLTALFMTEDVERIFLWSIEALTLSFILYKYKLEYLANWIIVFVSAAMLNVFFVDNVVFNINYKPIFNISLKSFACPILTAYFSYLLIRNNESEAVRKTAQIIRFLYISMMYLYVCFELNNFMNSEILTFNTDKNFIKTMLFSIIGFKYGVQFDLMSRINNFKPYKIIGTIISIISLGLILNFGLRYESLISFIPIINIRFIAYSSAITNAIICARRSNLAIYKYIAIILGFILLSIETIDFIDKYDLNTNYIISVLWLLYAAIITFIGIFRKRKYLKNSGIWLSMFAVIKIFFYDIANVNMVYKFIILLALGVIFMFTSYFYNRNKN